MNQLFLLNETMSSLEIAELTNKDHKNILVNIRKMLTELEIHTADFSAVYKADNGQEYECFNLPKRECDILISGYEIKYRAAIIDRWYELEANKPKLTLAESNLQYAQSVVDLERAQKLTNEKQLELENAQKEIDNNIDQLQNDNQFIKTKVSNKFIETDNRINEIEQITQRKGVPLNYTSAKVAWKKDGRVSRDVFKEIMDVMGVSYLTYSITSPEGYVSYPTAYKTCDIKPAIDIVINGAYPYSKNSKHYFKSPYIKSKFILNT